MKKSFYASSFHFVVQGGMKGRGMPALIAMTVFVSIFVASWGLGAKDKTSVPPKGTSVSIGLKPQTQDNKTPSSEDQAMRLWTDTGATSAPLSPRRIGHPGTTVPGQVTVELAKTSFREGERVQAIVANGLDQPVYTENQKSDCTIVKLERLKDGLWEWISGCAFMERLPSVVEIGPGEVVEVTINPHRQQPGPIGAPLRLAFGEGTYRVALLYWPAINREKETTVTSPEFAIIR
jgi:hypothetical protein